MSKWSKCQQFHYLKNLADAKIPNLHRTIMTNQQIIRFDITVYYVLLSKETHKNVTNQSPCIKGSLYAHAHTHTHKHMETATILLKYVMH